MQVFEFQRRWNQPYGNFCEGRTVADWKSIPAVPTAAFKDLDHPLACFPVRDAIGYFETSGTTGEVRGRHYFYNFEMYRLSIELGWAALPLLSFGVPPELPRHWLPGLGDRSSLRFM